MESKPARGFPALRCLYCGVESGCLLHLEDMTVACSECDGTFTPEEIRTEVARWQAVLAWIELAPAVES